MIKNGDLPAMPIELSGFGQYAPEAHAGLTKREMFAMAAMQGFCQINLTFKNKQSLAAQAVEVADALLAELERTK